MKLQRLYLTFASTLLLTSSLAAPSPQPDPNDVSESLIQEREPSIPGGQGKFQRPGKPTKATKDTKYFHEPGANDELGHYDIRYYTGNPVSYNDHRAELRYLIRAYLTLFRERNIETWIAHGTLLGWWWNGKIMPWDPDLDVQVSASTLTWLGENMNMTFHDYTGVSDDGETIHRKYLLDINPNSAERVRGDGQNVIDARFVNTHNGMFIDITGLSETNPSIQPGVWSCKNFHRYRTRDLYPMRETVFEGVPATVPYSFDKILMEEYSQKALTKTQFQGHRWLPEIKEWVKEEPVFKSGRKGSRSVDLETTTPHVPRSLQGDNEPASGLRNLKRVFT